MAFEDWDKNPDGSISVYPVLGWDSFVPFGMACGIRVHYAPSPSELAPGSQKHLPLILTPAQARELAEALLKSAAKAEQSNGTPSS